MDPPAAPRSLLRSFQRHLRAQNRSERTVGNYLESARLADAFLEGRGKRLEQATQADLENFVAHILRRRSASTNALACRRGSTRANRPATRAGNSSSPTCQRAGDKQGGPGCAKGITRISLCQPDTRSLVRWLAPPGWPQSRPRWPTTGSFVFSAACCVLGAVASSRRLGVSRAIPRSAVSRAVRVVLRRPVGQDDDTQAERLAIDQRHPGAVALAEQQAAGAAGADEDGVDPQADLVQQAVGQQRLGDRPEPVH